MCVMFNWNACIPNCPTFMMLSTFAKSPTSLLMVSTKVVLVISPLLSLKLMIWRQMDTTRMTVWHNFNEMSSKI